MMTAQLTIVFKDAAIIMGTVLITLLLITLTGAGNTMRKTIAINNQPQWETAMEIKVMIVKQAVQELEHQWELLSGELQGSL